MEFTSTAGELPSIEDDEVPVFWACGFSVSQCLKDAAPPLAFTHSCATMFIADVKPDCENVTDKIDVFELSRPGDPYVASILETSSVEILANLEKSLLDSPAKEGVGQESDLTRVVLTLSHASRVAIILEETAGLPGALSICQALLTLSKEVVLIGDSGNMKSCVNHAIAQGILKSQVEVITCPGAIEMWKESSADCPSWDCIVAFESSAGTGGANDRSVVDLFVMANANPLANTVSIRNGGTGKITDQGVGDVPVDRVVVADVSNWAGYAVAVGLYTVSSSPYHSWYRNRGIVGDTALKLDVKDFVSTTDQIGSLLEYVSESGSRTHLDKITHLLSFLK